MEIIFLVFRTLKKIVVQEKWILHYAHDSIKCICSVFHYSNSERRNPDISLQVFLSHKYFIREADNE